MNLMEILKSKEGFNENERSICEYILSHSEELVHLSARELGRRTFTSSTVVVRLCQKLGYPSYSEFKVRFLVDMRTYNEDTFLEKDEHMISILNKVATKQQQAIEQMNVTVSMEDIKVLVKHLMDVDYIDVIALDVNKAIAEYACQNFYSAGKIANVYSSYHSQYMLTQLADKDHHVVFLISKSGKTRELLKIAKELRAHQIFCVALTSDIKSPLAQLSSLTLPCLFQDDFHSLQDMIFSESAIYLFNVLTAMLISYDYDRASELKEKYDQEYYKIHG